MANPGIPRMTSFIGMGQHPGPMPPAWSYILHPLVQELHTHTHTYLLSLNLLVQMSELWLFSPIRFIF